MKNLVGRSFLVAETRYRVVDVQRLGGDALIYAEQVESKEAAGPHVPARRPGRAAFHYRDIATLLNQPDAPAAASVP